MATGEAQVDLKKIANNYNISIDQLNAILKDNKITNLSAVSSERLNSLVNEYRLSTPAEGGRPEYRPPVTIPQQPKESTETPVTVQDLIFYADNGATLVMFNGSLYEIRDEIAKEAVELSKSPEFEEEVKSAGVTHNDIRLFLGMKRVEEEKEKISDSLTVGMLEHKEKIEAAEVREHKGFVEEKVRKETGAQEEERARVTEERKMKITVVRDPEKVVKEFRAFIRTANMEGAAEEIEKIVKIFEGGGKEEIVADIGAIVERAGKYGVEKEDTLKISKINIC